MEDVVLTDTLLVDGGVVATTSVAIGTVPPNEGRRVVLDVLVPETGSTLENQLDYAICATHPCTKVVTPIRGAGIYINEVVVEPQRDWDDSGAGGNGVAFDDMPGSAIAPDPSVTAADQWIEFITNTGSPAELTNYTLSFTDASGTPQTVTLGPANLVTSAGTPYVLVGAPGNISRTSVIQLRDTTNRVVDEIDLAAISAKVGFATGVGNEALARVPDGRHTNGVDDFARRPATIRKQNQ
jgi:hypothetical protein